MDKHRLVLAAGVVIAAASSLLPATLMAKPGGGQGGGHAAQGRAHGHGQEQAGEEQDQAGKERGRGRQQDEEVSLAEDMDEGAEIGRDEELAALQDFEDEAAAGLGSFGLLQDVPSLSTDGALQLASPGAQQGGEGANGLPPGFSHGQKKGWKNGRPPGWSHGKKKGWKGAGMPPGLARHAHGAAQGERQPGAVEGAPKGELQDRGAVQKHRRVDPQVLTMIGPDSLTVLVRALKHEDVQIRWMAADALGTLGTNASSAVPALREALQDTDADVRAAAAASLEQIASGSP